MQNCLCKPPQLLLHWEVWNPYSIIQIRKLRFRLVHLICLKSYKMLIIEPAFKSKSLVSKHSSLSPPDSRIPSPFSPLLSLLSPSPCLSLGLCISVSISLSVSPSFLLSHSLSSLTFFLLPCLLFLFWMPVRSFSKINLEISVLKPLGTLFSAWILHAIKGQIRQQIKAVWSLLEFYASLIWS